MFKKYKHENANLLKDSNLDSQLKKNCKTGWKPFLHSFLRTLLLRRPFKERTESI